MSLLSTICKKKKGSTGNSYPRNQKEGRGGGIHYTDLCTNIGVQEDGDLELCMLSGANEAVEFQHASLKVFEGENGSFGPLKTRLSVDGHSVEMEIDNGAAYSIISEDE